MKSKWRAVIGALFAPSYIGGLGAYQRGLASVLESLGGEGVFLSVFPKHPALGISESPIPWPVKYGLSSAAWAKHNGLMLRLAARPALHPLIELIISAALPAKSLSKLSGKADWVHFVGTGRDYMGFALERLARKAGVRFTIWPAVHPHDWGDDVLDVRLYRKADAVMCQTHFEKNHLADLGVPENKLLYCGLPPMCLADGNADSIRRELDLGNRPCVLFLGRRDKGKGYFALLEAWSGVLQAFPEACLLLGGPGDPRPDDLAKLPPGSFRDLGLANEVTKAQALAACNIFCLPSSHESFGIAYVEAWSYRKPVICGTAPACREFIEDGKTGLWADQDPQNLASKIRMLFEQPALARSLGENGYALQQERFSWSVVAAAHLRAAGLQPIAAAEDQRSV
jgi:glycosyltransferase involved in cell wall biosynthesis